MDDRHKVEKRWKHKGLKCVVLFVGGSHRCGYVGVPEGHRAFGVDYDDVNMSVHGGLTFSDYGKANDVLKGSDTYWLGFDCAHYGDKTSFSSEGHFWTLEEAVKETESLAEQLAVLQEAQTLTFDIKEFLEHNSLARIKKLKKQLEAMK